jgi:hypothetical protein
MGRGRDIVARDRFTSIFGNRRGLRADQQSHYSSDASELEYATDGTKEWRRNGKRHRDDGPAVERPDGTKEWWLNGQLHREDGPAVEHSNGTREWWVNGQRHRNDGPAIEREDGTKEWLLNGQLYRQVGPSRA